MKRPRLRTELFRPVKDRASGASLGIWTYQGKEVLAPAGMPGSLRLLGKHFDVRYHTHIYMQRKRSERLLGCVLLHHQVILIEPGDRSLHEMRQTLYHEVCHVYLAHSGAKLEHAAEEIVCDVLGSGMYDLTCNNDL